MRKSLFLRHGMVYQGDGVFDFSQSISNVEVALYEYAISPQLGLEKLHVSLSSFQSFVSSNYSLQDIFYQRLSSFLFSVEQLIDSGSPYFKHYHAAFMSAFDSLFQIVLARRLSDDRAQQLYSLLSIERSCWSILLSVEKSIDYSLAYVNYEAEVILDDLPQEQTIESYLKALSSVGSVSFCLDSVQSGLGPTSGRFKLLSIQPIEWLRLRFPSFNWSITPISNERALKEVCELSFLPLFQNSAINRGFRRYLLDLFGFQFKLSFYQSFGSTFLPNDSVIVNENWLVPIKGRNSLIQCDERLTYFPVRHNGVVNIATRYTGIKELKFSYLDCLGKDFLSYFLYEVETCAGQFVFDQKECLGIYDVREENIAVVNGAALFKSSDVEAQIVFDFSISTSNCSASCLLIGAIEKVLVVSQAEVFFAIPFLSLREVEGVSAQIMQSSSIIKNVWLNQSNKPFIEPWLLDNECVPRKGGLLESKSPSPQELKSGYYLGIINGLSFWLDAQLVSLIEPFEITSFVAYFNNDLQEESLLIHNGLCFNNITSSVKLSHSLGSGENDYSFSVILDWMGVSTVLCLESCNWHSELPREHDGQEEPPVFRNEKSCFSALSNSIVVSKENYLSFVADSLSSSSLA